MDMCGGGAVSVTWRAYGVAKLFRPRVGIWILKKIRVYDK